MMYCSRLITQLLSMAWDISKFTYDSKSFGASSNDLCSGFYVKSDGSGFYEVADPNAPTQNRVIECSMTSWNLSSASNVSTFNLPTSVFDENEGIFFKDDGSRMFIVRKDSTHGRFIQSYSLSSSWDVTTASTLSVFSVATQIALIAQAAGLFFKGDGTKMYITSGADAFIYQYNLSSSWDITTSSFINSFNLNAQLSSIGGFFIKPDGTKLYAPSLNSAVIYQYSMSTPWDITSLSYDSINLTSAVTNPSDLFIKSTGDRMFLMDNVSGVLYQYSISSLDNSLYFAGN